MSNSPNLINMSPIKLSSVKTPNPIDVLLKPVTQPSVPVSNIVKTTPHVPVPLQRQPVLQLPQQAPQQIPRQMSKIPKKLSKRAPRTSVPVQQYHGPPNVPIVNSDTFKIFGYDIKKMHVYIIIIIVIAVVGYFAYRWYKNKQNDHTEEDEMNYGMHRMVSPDIYPTMHRMPKNMPPHMMPMRRMPKNMPMMQQTQPQMPPNQPHPQMPPNQPHPQMPPNQPQMPPNQPQKPMSDKQMNMAMNNITPDINV